MNLAGLTSVLVEEVAALTGLPTGDGVAPAVGQPTIGDYPYLVVYDITDLAVHDLGGWQPGHYEVTWQITAVGLTRLQACVARDRARGVLNPTLPIQTDDVAVVGREQSATMLDPSDGGQVWSAHLRMQAIAAAS